MASMVDHRRERDRQAWHHRPVVRSSPEACRQRSSPLPEQRGNSHRREAPAGSMQQRLRRRRGGPYRREDPVPCQSALNSCQVHLEPGQCRMGRIRVGLKQVPAARVVECVDRLRVAGKCLGPGELHRIELLPETTSIAEGPQTALGRDAGELCRNLGDAVIRRHSVLACW